MMTATHRNLICDAIEEIASLTSLSQVGASFAVTLAKLGFNSLGINGLPPPEEDADPVILTEIAPNGFRDLYIHERFYAVDHIAAHARTAYEPFRFSEAPYDPRESQAHERFIEALQSFHMGKGVIVPLGRPANIPACVWLAGDNPEMHDDALLATQLISLFTASKVRALSRPRRAGARPGTLTKREREVLQWISVGKTSWEISVISGLSERAINNIIAVAMQKLDAVTRVQAVVNAIRQGEVEL